MNLLVEADVIRGTSRSSDTAHIGGGGDVTSHLPQLRRVLTGRKSAGFACDQAVAREFQDVRGRLSVAQHERLAALSRRSMVSSGKHRRSRVQRLSSAMISADRPSCASQGTARSALRLGVGPAEEVA